MNRVTVSYWTDELGRWMRCGTHYASQLRSVLIRVLDEIDEEQGTGVTILLKTERGPVRWTVDDIREILGLSEC